MPQRLHFWPIFINDLKKEVNKILVKLLSEWEQLEQKWVTYNNLRRIQNRTRTENKIIKMKPQTFEKND